MSKLTNYEHVVRRTATRIEKLNIDLGEDGSARNILVVRQCITSWAFLLEDIMIQEYLTERSREVRLSNWLTGLESSSFLSVVDLFNEVYEYVVRCTNPHAGVFKALLEFWSDKYKVKAELLLSPLRPLINRFISVGHPETVQALASGLRFASKLSLESDRLEDGALADYISVERELDDFDLDRIDPELLNYLEDVLTYWLKDFEVSDAMPKHGRGSVSDIRGNKSAYSKWTNLSYDKKVDIVCRKEGGISAFFPNVCTGFKRKSTVERISKTVFVPKNIKKLRTISMEPVTLQFFQQRARGAMYSYFKKHEYLKRHIKLQDRTLNQRYAREGSVHNNLCTIDLSAASDRISWSLVRRIFRSTPNYLKWLMATRSEFTRLPDDAQTVLKLNKFAPMGSALCFPTQCLVFAAVVEYSLKTMSTRTDLRLRTWAVYGDDIIAPVEAYTFICENLTALGFKVNMDKSFTDGPFRESCGGDYYAGFEVNPLYWRCDIHNVDALSPSAFSGLCAYANLAYHRNYSLLRLHCIHTLRLSREMTKHPGKRGKPIKPLFIGSDMQSDNVRLSNLSVPSTAIISDTPTNFHAKASYVEEYQNWYGQFTQLSSEAAAIPDRECDVLLKHVMRAAVASPYWVPLSPRRFNKRLVVTTYIFLELYNRCLRGDIQYHEYLLYRSGENQVDEEFKLRFTHSIAEEIDRNLIAPEETVLYETVSKFSANWVAPVTAPLK